MKGSAKPEVISRFENIRKNLELRSSVLFHLREFFLSRNFIEVETPVRISSPAPEVHIDAIASVPYFLRTSPEFQMKTMLCAGYPKIFQIGPCFRENEIGRLHREEFTMLEWYHAGVDYEYLIGFTKEMILYVLKKVLKSDVCCFRGFEINFSTEWRIMTVDGAFAKFANVSAAQAVKNGNFEELLVSFVEPGLAVEKRPVILKDYPAELAAFAKIKDADKAVAERWELYLGGVEIANAYSELNDPVEQIRRFKKYSETRKSIGKKTYPEDGDFLEALSFGMPECAGCALGIDRLIMVFAGASEIGEVRAAV